MAGKFAVRNAAHHVARAVVEVLLLVKGHPGKGVVGPHNIALDEATRKLGGAIEELTDAAIAESHDGRRR